MGKILLLKKSVNKIKYFQSIIYYYLIYFYYFIITLLFQLVAKAIFFI